MNLKSVKDLRNLPAGTVFDCVQHWRSAAVGPKVLGIRTLKKAKRHELVFTTPTGEESYMHLPEEEHLKFEGNRLTILLDQETVAMVYEIRAAA